ncbi:MAG TPA: peptidoglycan DD-metalloendopeptidase family protein [Acidimicrobiales bacterium]|nr:peptidoglycan DD-metalloendopeptidase family protein [Acidimicrobiales bacterium]
MLALVVGLAAPAAAASTSSARKRQAEVRAAKAKAAAQLNGLRASDDQLEKAVAALATQVRAQNAKVASAQQAVNVAEAAVRTAEARIASTESEMTSLQGAVVDRAVAAYVRPQQAALAGLSDARNLEDASRRASMLRQVANSDRDILDQLRATREDLGIEKEKAATAKEVAAHRRAAANQQLSAYKANLAEKARLEAALDNRIRAVTGEVEAFAKEDAAIQSLLNSEAARAAAAARASRNAAGAADSGGRISGSGMRWPAGGPVTSDFGSRWGRLHAGLDIGAGSGAPIRAAKSGTVIFSGSQGGYGNVVIIEHGGGLTTLYAHMSRRGVSDGAEVSTGDYIGAVGSTGHSTGPHLHFETRLGGSPQNPRRYLP